MEIDLTSAVGHLFCHNPTYSDLDIARRITEGYNIEHLTLTARFVKRIRLEQGWRRRHNDPAAAEVQEAGTIDVIEQLLAEASLASTGTVLAATTSSQHSEYSTTTMSSPGHLSSHRVGD
jgi:hypothetical protein